MNFTPVLLRDTVSIPAGQSRNPDLRRLQHPFRRAMYIDEIRFWIDQPVDSTIRALNRQLGGSVRARFSIGRAEITTQAVPIWNFDTATALFYGEAPNGGAADGSTTRRNKSFYRWRLSKPLLVPPGSVLVPTLSRQTNDGWSADSANDLPVTIAYAGRALPQDAALPRETPVPYVGVWIDGRGGTNQTESGDLDLVNPFQKPLHVGRFVGRLRRYTDAAGGAASDAEDDFSASTDWTVWMKDSKGRDFIRAPLPFNEVFDRQTRSWLCPFVLGPRERILARIKDQITTATVTYEPMISMVGYRHEPLGVL